jgi:hypothetical protein
MPDEPLAHGASYTVRGLHRGAELGGRGSVELGERELVLTVAHSRARWQRRIAVAYDAMDGARLYDDHLTIYLDTGDLIELAGAADLAALAGELAGRVCAFPELTLRLRGLGSGRANPGSDHDRFFGPLLSARRSAAQQGSPLGMVDALRAAPLRATYDRTLAGFAAERFPEHPADRRALEAELDELAEPLMASIDALDAAEREVRASADDVRFARWRAWAAAVQRTFDEADRLWIAALPALCDSRGREGRFWRRVLRLAILVAALP